MIIIASMEIIMKMLFVSDLFEAMGRMSNANQAKQIFVSTTFLLLLRTVTSLDVGKEVYEQLQIKLLLFSSF